MSNHEASNTTPTSEHSSEPVGEMIEDIVEGTVSEASPSESSSDDGGTDQAGRDGHRYSDDSSFNA